jgi:TonB family protein
MKRGSMVGRFGLAILGLFAVYASISARDVETKVVTPPELWSLFEVKKYPVYPYEAMRSRITGSGIFRIYANPDGTIRTVGVMKSTGSQILDLAAAGGLYHCKLKPSNKRREIDMPVTFTTTRP